MRQDNFNPSKLQITDRRIVRPLILGLVFLLCLGAGLLSGYLIKQNNNPADAARAYITVENNNQTVTVDQTTGSQVIQRNSTVTIKDPTATIGYTLFAKLSQNSLPGATVTMGSSSSTTCTTASPCNIVASEARTILSTNNSNSTTASGETTTWVVKITVPAGTAVGGYIFDIEYSEESDVAMQNYTAAQCQAAASGSILTMKDARNGTYYRVKKMVDGNCWMVDNLALDLTSNYAGKPSWGTTPVTVSGTTTSVANVPQQAMNNNIAGQGQIPNNGSPKASYLYNWCAALGDTSANCASSVAATTNNTVINGTTVTSGTTTSQPEVIGICPTGWRLPKGGPEATSSTPTTTANEFAKLDIAMGGTGAGRSSANTHSLFMGTATTNTNWLGMFGGNYYNGFNNQGAFAQWWSSTAWQASTAYFLDLNIGGTFVHPALDGNKTHSFSVRCLLNPSESTFNVNTMQEMTKYACDIAAYGATKSLRDTRDGTYYRVKKMVNGKCWMVDNLALDLTSTYTGKPSWGTAPVTISGTTASAANVPQQALNTGYNTNGSVTTYLYNWCAALADTSSTCAASQSATTNNTVINGAVNSTGSTTSQPEVTGICPAPFRLPKGGPEATSSSSASTANEFAKLDIAMGGTGANRSSANTYSLFMGTATTNTNWLGMFGGNYYNGFNNQGAFAHWWSSTAWNDSGRVYSLYLNRGDTRVNPASNYDKAHGFAVRCML